MRIKLVLFIIIVLLVTLLCPELFATQYFPDDLDLPPVEKPALVSHYSKILESMKELPLWPLAKDTTVVSYRFIYLRAARVPVLLRLDRVTNAKWLFTVKEADNCSKTGFAVNRRKRLSKNQIRHFQELFAQLEFWQLPSTGAFEAEHDVLDGTHWILEVVENGRYHLIQRISPNSTGWEVIPPILAKRFEKLREGYPNTDRGTSEAVNKRLVAVGKFLMELSGLEIKINVE